VCVFRIWEIDPKMNYGFMEIFSEENRMYGHSAISPSQTIRKTILAHADPLCRMCKLYFMSLIK
jgi:hypothetical protein